jgi:hypothetical protein
MLLSRCDPHASRALQHSAPEHARRTDLDGAEEVPLDVRTRDTLVDQLMRPLHRMLGSLDGLPLVESRMMELEVAYSKDTLGVRGALSLRLKWQLPVC